MKIFKDFEALVQYGLKHELIEKTDVVYVRNRLAMLVGLVDYEEHSPTDFDSIQDLLDSITTYAVESNVVSDERFYKEQLQEQIMDLLTPKPSVINKKFYELFEDSKEAATNYFYELSKRTNYIKTKQIARNIKWDADTEFGNLEMTINLSKPEKDPKEIEKLKSMPKSGYPSCFLCYENVGFQGRLNHPIRLTHRVIPLTLGGNDWFMQYSPYSYYNEHAIIIDMNHENMVINRKTFEMMTDFLDQFPHYFIGSNADLPIVGGSILNHNHFQSGRYEFPLNKAKSVYKHTVGEVDFDLLDWPMATIKLTSSNKELVIDYAEALLNDWANYEDKDINVINGSFKEHSTITPIARMVDGKYEFYLVLRNNITTEDVSYGLFHPRADYHHLKKENIGLIEVMGLSILPGRLVAELDEIKNALTNSLELVDSSHNEWYQEIKERFTGDVDTFVEEEVAERFGLVISDCHVFRFAADKDEMFKTYLEGFISKL
jgi:UDPglucose--hexose-1-phosphate uridylyltransferase